MLNIRSRGFDCAQYYIVIYIVVYCIYAKEWELSSEERLPFNVKYLMRTSLERAYLFSSKRSAHLKSRT